MSEFDGSAHTLDGDFGWVDPEIELLAAEARPLLRAAADALYDLLSAIERSGTYKDQQ